MPRNRPWYEDWEEQCEKAWSYLRARQLTAASLDAHRLDETVNFRLLTLSQLIYESNTMERAGLSESDTKKLLLDEKFLGSNYAQRIISCFDETPLPAVPIMTKPLVEPLSSREMDVLRMLNTELSGPEISGEMNIALSTLRFHTRNIYGKLQVNNRRSAVRTAEKMHLI